MSKAKSSDQVKYSDFDLGDKIGKGGFGTVYKAFWKTKGIDVAIKEIDTNDWRQKKRVNLEVDHHRKADHQSIVKFYAHFTEGAKDYIVMELCAEGSLRKYINDDGPLPYDKASSVINQLVITLLYLHSKGMCFRDLTPGNLLISRFRENGLLSIKLCDFGLAKEMHAGKAQQTMAGTPGYMDPNVANHEHYGKEVDLYSLGCLIYAILTGQEPDGSNMAKPKFTRLNYLERDEKDLIEALTCNVDKRISLEEVIQSAYMKRGLVENSTRSRSRDHPSSIRGHRLSMDRKSLDRRTINSIEQPPIRERSKSRGPFRERNQSPPPMRQAHTSRSSSQVRLNPKESCHLQWPINIDRLAGKFEERRGYRLDVLSENEVVLKREGSELMRIRVKGGIQRIGILECSSRSHPKPCFNCIKWMEELPKSLHSHYETVISLLESIRWKVAKVILNNASICEGGIVRLMENGDLRMKDAKGNIFSVEANCNRVHEGDPRKPERRLTDDARVNEILNFRDFCKDMETSLERLGMKFPFVSYVPTADSKTVKKNVNDALEDRNRPSCSSGTTDQRNSRRNISVDPISRTKSAYSNRKSTQDQAFTINSAPAASKQGGDKENRGNRLVLVKDSKGTIRAIKDETNRMSLRHSATAANLYVFTNSDGSEDRFTFTGDYSSLTPSQHYLMRRLEDSKNRR